MTPEEILIAEAAEEPSSASGGTAKAGGRGSRSHRRTGAHSFEFRQQALSEPDAAARWQIFLLQVVLEHAVLDSAMGWVD